MKKFIMLLSVIALVMVAMVPTAGKVSAQAFPGYVTGTQVMNLGTGQATITLEYYNADDGSTNAGKVMDTASDTININSSKTYFPTLQTFKGSMVISSSQPLGAVTNLQNSAKTAGASYVGASKGASHVQIPLLMKNNGTVPYNTWYSVQNAGSSDATVTITYSDYATPQTIVVKSNSSKTVYQASEGFHTQKVFSASLSSTQPIVVVVVEENTAKIFAYNGFPGDTGDISTDLVAPLVNENNNGTTTGFQVQNTSNFPSNVTVSYTPSAAGTACTETQTIAANSSATFALIAFSTSNASVSTTCKNEKFVGSARVTGNSANALLVGIVNQSKPIMGEAYGAFNPGLATAKVVMPLLMDRNGTTNWSTGFAVMNAGSAATYVKCTATNSTYSVSGLVQPNAALTQLQGNAISAGYVGSGSCIAYSDAGYTQVNSSAKLVAVVNETGTPTADRLLVYEGINVAP